jgi:hypothetical protein
VLDFRERTYEYNCGAKADYKILQVLTGLGFKKQCDRIHCLYLEKLIVGIENGKRLGDILLNHLC